MSPAIWEEWSIRGLAVEFVLSLKWSPLGFVILFVVEEKHQA